MISLALSSSLRPKFPSPIHSGQRQYRFCNLGAPRPAVGFKLETQDCRLGLGRNGLQSATISTARTAEQSKDNPDHEDFWGMVNDVKRMLGSMSDGEISSSAYDTAWVALVPNLNGDKGPQFPSSLQWIIDNQLGDGSWGDKEIFLAHDRMINTLACVIALTSWNICPEKRQKGLMFLRKNMWRLAKEEEELMSIGFEVAFPSLIDMAKKLELDFPYDDPALLEIYAKKDLKLKKIPNKVMHEVSTTLLHSVEGMTDLDWSKLIKLQSEDGSFLFSPSATAYALAQTKDEKCFKYLEKAVMKFGGGVPNVYPVDLFEHIWAVDRLQRLGISRYFETEIKECLDYVYRYWTEKGICWARNSSVQDVDDTAMGFRLLRLHGYDVSADVFKNFEKDGEFFCFVGQTNQAVTGIYNINRASQVMFPGESILERASEFSYKFLREKQAKNQLRDKWIITKDLPGEVDYTLEFPFSASLPRVEARSFLDHYGGRNDTWIGKTLYRMHYVNNDVYLKLAKDDFNECQAIHQKEWRQIHKWYNECGLESQGMTLKSVLRDYFLAMACIFEPERASERLAWAKTAVLAKAVSSYFRNETFSEELKENFISEFQNFNTRFGGLVGSLFQLLNDLVSCNANKTASLRHAWEEWMMNERAFGRDETALLLVRTMEICSGQSDPLTNPKYNNAVRLTSSISALLGELVRFPEGDQNSEKTTADDMIESEMKAMVQCVLKTNDRTTRTFLAVVKSYYYAYRCSSATVDSHIKKVLFERVA